MKKENIIFIILGIIFTFLPFFIFTYSILRLISVMFGIILLCIGLILNTNNKIFKIILFPVMISFFVYLLDYYTFILFKKTPIIAINYKSSEKVSTYNSILYRVFNCDNSLILDKKYQKSYSCKNEDITLINLNDFLVSETNQVYKENKNKFVHLKGRISKIIGNNTIEVRPYNGEVELNGYVNFDNSKKIVIENVIMDPTKYYIYDEIEFIGLVEKYENIDSEVIIHLIDVKLIENNIYNNYEIIINNNNTKDLENILDKVYYLGIDNIYYKFNEENIYDLSYVLSDKRDSIDNIVKGKEYDTLENDNRLYKFDKFNIIRCNNEKTIFINKNYKITNEICE